MASIRNTAQGIIEEAREGIAWIAFFKKGRGWDASCFWPDIDKGGSFEFEKDDIKEIKSILSTDRNADIIFELKDKLPDIRNVKVTTPEEDVLLDSDKVIVLGKVTVTARRV